jgi:hypothetical protein
VTGRTLGIALGTSDVFVLLILVLALLGLLVAPMAFIAGRRRGRW